MNIAIEKFPSGTDPIILPGKVESVDHIKYLDPQRTTQCLTGLTLGSDGKTITPAAPWPTAHGSKPYIRIFVS